MDREELRTKIQDLWCQHCKAIQKTMEVEVRCYYKPLDKESPGYCAANEDVADSLMALLPAAKDKAPVLTKDQLLNAVYADASKTSFEEGILALATAQRDADHIHYRG